MISHSPAYELAPCPVCGSMDSRTIAQREDVREEVEDLWAFHTRRLRGDTPAERLTDRVAFSHPPPFRVVQCRGCGLVYRNPRERAFELEAMYVDAAPEPAVLEALHETQRSSYDAQAERLVEVAGKRGGSGVEVGSFVGGFLAASRERGWTFEGLDVNDDVNAFVRAKGFRVTTGALDEFEPNRLYDAVAIWNTFDQLPDPREAATRARALLAPGGLLALRFPNGEFYARLRPKLDGPAAPIARALLAHNNLLTFPYRHGFTVHSITRLLADTGFNVTRVFGDTLVPIADEWTLGWAAWEERALKRALRVLAKAGAESAPWLEVFARAT
ncbi:MAG TPA: methyltransferase domain-containing protein [Gemmatimonadaceae bacterium]|nr:methyltransferase domain-containing protein [Gemmatimonadaceae bacterium]